MTFDERIDRLTERHEALARSLELLSHELRELKEICEENFTNIAGSLTNLLRIAENHERRLTRLEGTD